MRDRVRCVSAVSWTSCSSGASEFIQLDAVAIPLTGAIEAVERGFVSENICDVAPYRDRQLPDVLDAVNEYRTFPDSLALR